MDVTEDGWTRWRVLTCAGSVLIVTLVAFESIGVATAMPTVARELGAIDSLPLAFAVPLAAGIIAMVCAGTWADRVGPRRVLLIGMTMFTAGLIIAGAAQSMPMLVAARVIQGFGGGLDTVALYVVIAAVFPDRLRARVFVWNSTAWVAPAIFGPPVAGWLAGHGHWRWVFDGAALFVIPALLLMVPVLTRLGDRATVTRQPGFLSRAVAACGAAVGAFALSMCAAASGLWIASVALIGVLLVVACAPRLMPHGTYRAVPGLPATILSRGLLGSAFLGTEVMLPLMLTQQHHLSPTGAGIVLTVGGLAWTAAAWISGRVADHDGLRRFIRIGFGLLAAGIALCLGGVSSSMPSILVYAGWLLAGVGVGLAYSPITVLMMAAAPRNRQGTSSAALQTNESLMTAVVVAAGAAAFGQLASVNRGLAFTTVFAVALAVAAIGLLVTRRLAPEQDARLSAVPVTASA